MAKELLDYFKSNRKKISEMDKFLGWIFSEKVEKFKYPFGRGLLMNLAMEYLFLEKEEEKDYYYDEDGIKWFKESKKHKNKGKVGQKEEEKDWYIDEDGIKRAKKEG